MKVYILEHMMSQKPYQLLNKNTRKRKASHLMPLSSQQILVTQSIEHKLVPDNDISTDGSSSNDEMSTTEKPYSGKMMNVVEYFVKHNLSWTAFEELLVLINDFDPLEPLPTTRHMVEKLIINDFPAQFHAICHNCQKYIGSFKGTQLVCTTCGAPVDLATKDGSYFATFNIPTIIDRIISKYQNVIVTKDRQRKQNIISDVVDGKLYQQANESHERPIVSIVFNTDGVSMFNGNQKSLWPILFTINELPADVRFQDDNVCVAGIFFG